MSKKYHLDQNEVAYLHCVNSAFAGVNYALETLNPKGITKKDLIKALQGILAQANGAICSEYIRGELISKNVIENDPNLLCIFDPSVDNEDSLAEVFTQDELSNIRARNK